MNWSSIGNEVAKAAPLVGSLLLGPSGSAVGSMIASALGVDATPDSVDAAINADPQAAVKIRELELNNHASLTRMALEAETARLSEINKTMRAEAASNDAYVRRWRPTFGYMVAITWFIQTAAIAAAIVASSFVYPEQAGGIMNGIAQLVGAMMAMWAIALSVLGVSVTQRSKDKQVQAGQKPQGLIDLIRGGK